jgi:hypothetical protein
MTAVPHPLDPPTPHRPPHPRANPAPNSGRRSCDSATAPHSGQHTRSAVVMTACSSSPSRTDTANTTEAGASLIPPLLNYSKYPPGVSISVSMNTVDHEAPCLYSRAGGSSCQQLTTLKDEEPEEH